MREDDEDEKDGISAAGADTGAALETNPNTDQVQSPDVRAELEQVLRIAAEIDAEAEAEAELQAEAAGHPAAGEADGANEIAVAGAVADE